MQSDNPAFLEELLRLSIWLVLLSLIFVPLERLFAHHPQKILRKGLLLDLCYYFLSSTVPAVMLGVPMSLLALTAHRLLPAGFVEFMGALPLWGRVFLGLVAGEVGYYWGHRLSHELPFLWDFHAVHHSSVELDFLSNSRAHPFDMVFSRFCSFIPIYLLGLGGPSQQQGSTVPIAVTLLATAWGFFIHANLRWRLGPLEWLVSTPAFHHWHHTAHGPINKNYSSTLPLLDAIFGTLHLPRNQWPDRYGIEQAMPETLVGQILFPFQAPVQASVTTTEETVEPSVR